MIYEHLETITAQKNCSFTLLDTEKRKKSELMSSENRWRLLYWGLKLPVSVSNRGTWQLGRVGGRGPEEEPLLWADEAQSAGARVQVSAGEPETQRTEGDNLRRRGHSGVPNREVMRRNVARKLLKTSI